MSIQFLTRNLRRVASLRGFSSATVSEKPDLIDKTQNSIKQTRAKSSKSIDSMCDQIMFLFVQFAP